MRREKATLIYTRTKKRRAIHVFCPVCHLSPCQTIDLTRTVLTIPIASATGAVQSNRFILRYDSALSSNLQMDAASLGDSNPGWHLDLA